MILRASNFAGVIVPIAVLTGFALLRKYLPPRASRSPKSQTTGAEEEYFRTLKWPVGAAMLAIAATLAFACYEGLLIANRTLAAFDGPARFQLLPAKAIWCFFPGFAAMSLCWEITLLLWPLFGNRQMAERYTQWSNQKTGFDSTRALRWLALLLTLPIGIATALAIPMHTTLRENDIIVREYARLTPRRYAYSQARRLITIDGFRDREGKFTARSEVLVDFADGYRWHSGDNRDFGTTADQDMIKFFQQKTGLPLERAETEADLNRSASLGSKD